MKGSDLAELITSNKRRIIVGLGVTGQSVARWLTRRGEPFVAVDSRDEPPGLAAFRQAFPDVPVETGGLRSETLLSGGEIIVSPGVPLSDPVLVAAREAGIPVVGDIELFAREADAPIIAITGSNGKSTVTTLVGQMCVRAGKQAGVGGNLGTPALDLLEMGNDVYVLELSSFQLEAVERLNATVAVVLNVTPDHLDRYPSLIEYHRAKHRIFKGVRKVVVNRDDPLTQPLVSTTVSQRGFGLRKPDLNDFGLLNVEGESWLGKGPLALLPQRELLIKGSHNTANALAALALGEAIGLPLAVMLDELRVFRGLPHRCQTVAEIGGITYINDSKATNVGAAVAAIKGLASSSKLVLIAGGQGKGQDFTELGEVAAQHLEAVVILGEDAERLATALTGTHVARANSLEQAVALASNLAAPGGTVLLSPACASFDMFSNFAERGERFAAIVEALR